MFLIQNHGKGNMTITYSSLLINDALNIFRLYLLFCHNSFVNKKNKGKLVPVSEYIYIFMSPHYGLGTKLTSAMLLDSFTHDGSPFTNYKTNMPDKHLNSIRMFSCIVIIMQMESLLECMTDVSSIWPPLINAGMIP